MESKKSDCPVIDRQLVERFASGNGTVFVGAGISMRSKLPSWATLIEPLREELGARISPSASHLDVAELYETSYGRSELVRYLKRELGDVRYQSNRTHDLIVSLPVQRIYTTNFDDLLERAAHKKGINRHVIHDASHVGFSDTSTLSIVKLHGDLAAPGSLVISANDYYGYFTRNPAVADLLKVELQTHTVLFLGYSFSDPDFGMILGKVAAQSGPDRPLLYSLQLSPRDLAVRGLEKRGIKVIPLDAEPGTRESHKKVEQWLDCFLQMLRRYERRKRQQLAPVQAVRISSEIPRFKHSLIRLRTLRRLENMLHGDFAVIVVKGEAGIGKTQLVAKAVAGMLVPGGAVVVSDVFEDVVWIRPASADQPHTFCHILRTILNALESFPSAAYSPEEMTEEANRVLEEHRVIVVIEDLHDDPRNDKEMAAIKEWLEHLGSEVNPRSRIIVTSRSLDLLGFMVQVSRLNPDEAGAMVAEHAGSIMLRRAIPDGLGVEDIARLARCTLGNPQAIQLALGLVFGTGDTTAACDGMDENHTDNIEPLFAELIKRIVARLAPDALQVLRAMLVFPDSAPVPARLLRVACQTPENGKQDGFADAAEACVRFGLLERDTRCDTFGMHRTSKSLLARHFRDDPDPDGSFERLARHLLDFLRDAPDYEVACRREIDEEYWNVLVRDQMSKIDPYWPIIKHVMTRASQTPMVIDAEPMIVRFVLLLVHYMDSRLLGAERIEFIEAAIRTLETTPQKSMARANDLLALFKIDALAWTHIENGRPAQALEQIDAGLKLIKEGEHPELFALAAVWRARMASERKDYAEAHRELALATEAAGRAGKDWIHERVEMISGDVYYHESQAPEAQDPQASDADKEKALADRIGKAKQAEAAYRRAAYLTERYGGEGDGYQTSPRIALALLVQTNDPQAQEEAAQRFHRLVENSQVATGRLYGEYGLALLAANNNATHDALASLEAIHREIHHLGKGNVLLNLAETLYRKTLKQHPFRQRPGHA